MDADTAAADEVELTYWAQFDAIVSQVKDKTHVKEGLTNLCSFALENESDSVRNWAQDTTIEALQLHDTLIPPTLPSTASFLGGASIQLQVDTIKQTVLSLLRQPRSDSIPPCTMDQLQHILITDIDDAALFLELVDALLTSARPSFDMLPLFEIRVLEIMPSLSIAVRMTLWDTFPAHWEVQVAEWIRQAHVSPLRAMSRVLFPSSEDAAAFRVFYAAASHLHIVAMSTCQRLSSVYPTHRLLEVAQTLASFATKPTVRPIPASSLDNVTTWWLDAQDGPAITAACTTLVTRGAGNDRRASSVRLLSRIFAMQCPDTESRLMHVIADFAAVLTADDDDANPFRWLERHRDDAVQCATVTVTLLSVSLTCHLNDRKDDDRRLVMGLECFQYLLRLPPPPTIPDKRTFQVSLLGVFLHTLDQHKSLREHADVVASVKETVRLMQMDPDVALPAEWQRHVLERWSQEGAAPCI
ncbi:Aste57867_18004 [Aphanomyces stellatus]|uniref:Aste57867_18004 protein n=1 Tax=Aphanomyces stellatus TaxID=120398 RepID=A0A485LAN1_9STRA|nr:hypothetical protein As57867_017942 [Aphanomyces stellatus]VFT94743.1 Aste57867_18004 [Aphanomyces stellatus]